MNHNVRLVFSSTPPPPQRQSRRFGLFILNPGGKECAEKKKIRDDAHVSELRKAHVHAKAPRQVCGQGDHGSGIR